jgi:ABC-type bacteriocin/lantibiotic exporter with double-glycine peptidase domain
MIIINTIIFKKYNILEQELLTTKDSRMKTTTETFENIKILKLYNWENKFKEKIFNKRENELKVEIRGIKLHVTYSTLFWFTPVIVSIVTIGCYMRIHETFSISVILVGLSIFNLIQEPIDGYSN